MKKFIIALLLTFSSLMALSQVPQEFLVDSADFRIEGLTWILITDNEQIEIDTAFIKELDLSWISTLEVRKPKTEKSEGAKSKVFITLKDEYEDQFLLKIRRKE